MVSEQDKKTADETAAKIINVLNTQFPAIEWPFQTISGLVNTALATVRADERKAAVVEMEAQLKECLGNDHSSRGSETSHKSQIAYLQGVAKRANVTLICVECGFKLNGPYMPPGFCAVCQKDGVMVADVILNARAQTWEQAIEIAKKDKATISNRGGDYLLLSNLIIALEAAKDR